MRDKWTAALLIVGWMGVATYAAGCGANDAPASSEPAPMTGGDVVRGMLGVDRAGSSDRSHVAMANALVAEIEAMHPGRLAALEVDPKSRDPERIERAKILVDESIAEAASTVAGPALLGAKSGSVRILDQGSLVGPGESLVADAGGLVADGGPLLCEHPVGLDGQPLRLGEVSGVYGDGRTGAGAAAEDTADLVDTNDVLIWRTLQRVDSGELVPDPESRLGAYAATRGYGPGTVGNAVHNAIGTIFVTLGNYGQERIGRVFNSAEARALYDQPVTSCAGMQMAMLEHQYWRDVAAEDPWSPGGRMGSMFNPTARDLLQRRIFDR